MDDIAQAIPVVPAKYLDARDIFDCQLVKCSKLPNRIKEEFRHHRSRTFCALPSVIERVQWNNAINHAVSDFQHKRIEQKAIQESMFLRNQMWIRAKYESIEFGMVTAVFVGLNFSQRQLFLEIPASKL